MVKLELLKIRNFKKILNYLLKIPLQVIPNRSGLYVPQKCLSLSSLLSFFIFHEKSMYSYPNCAHNRFPPPIKLDLSKPEMHEGLSLRYYISWEVSC